MFFSPVFKKPLAFAARGGHNVVAECTDVACPGIGNLEPCQQNGNHGKYRRKCHGKLGAHRTAFIELKNASFAS